MKWTDDDVQRIRETTTKRVVRLLQRCGLLEQEDDGVEGKADYLVSGDQDLQVPETFEGIPIVGPAAFLEALAKRLRVAHTHRNSRAYITRGCSCAQRFSVWGKVNTR